MDRMAEVFLNFLQMWKHLAMEGQGKSKEVGDKKDDEEDMSLDQATLYMSCLHQLNISYCRASKASCCQDKCHVQNTNLDITNGT